MIDQLLANLAPHHCCGCNKIGCMMCAECKNNIIQTPFLRCISCMRPLAQTNLCTDCKWPFDYVWCVGERNGALQTLIDDVKFSRKQAGVIDMAELLDTTLPVLPTDTQIIPIPSSARSVRERGYDHMLLTARILAKKRKIDTRDILIRQSQARMHEITRRQERQNFAKTLFRLPHRVEITRPVLLIDDIVTTGATVQAAARLLRQHGVKHIMLAVLERHNNA